MLNRRIRVGVLGATGTVGQRLVQLLDGHPWFELAAVAASERSTGKPYAAACAWRLDTEMPECARGLLVREALPGLDCQIVFSALDADVAGPIERAFAEAGYVVTSNARVHRLEPDVPLLVPEVNHEHVELVAVQRRLRGWRGCIVTNPNCATATLVLALAPLERRFGIRSVSVTTLQAVSGAGYPGVPSLDIIGNVVPYIPGEEEKIETETRKILGRCVGGEIAAHPVAVSATATRVPVPDGHTLVALVNLCRPAALAAVERALREFAALPQTLRLPTAPSRPTIVRSEPDRPQPRMDLRVERGMATVIGRLRTFSPTSVRFVALGHNTVRGAAGAALLNAELLVARGVVS